ncbi:hypothetical protein [Jannaschia seohaensis]|uniref:Uncharacterized protein n=1 Tax=Jannaschia seohaensis TaxID=475081 RepID=A0A2Y9ART0_9RHOB|nr:hypothetical protein [Jannaschia seohaensis]PWJ19356.1 hypothetical protein BCF38_104292 [Jannaschia seohaensis]SSA46018.1 hypothetical protein SAMN05421539_104292 [Jannaschia seohaensis]
MAPPCVPKDNARWFIASSYAQPDARSHAAQAERGTFWALPVDVDSGNPSLEAVEAALMAVLGDVRWLVYSSRSATEDARKWRALVPLEGPLPGADYADTQAAFFALLDAEGLACDPALTRPGQLIYTPNRGAFYTYSLRSDPPRLTLTASAVVRQREADRSLRAAAEAAQHARTERLRLERLEQLRDGPSPIEAFNAANPVPDLLAHYGYLRAGASCDWRSPMQTSKSYATRAASDWWVSLSASDASSGLGAVSRAGAAYGDAFDLFVHFEHGGNRETALRAVLAGLWEGGSC